MSEIENPILIQDEMRQSYLDYAMSVIVGRALPDVRDGLKPVHRRVLYAMHDQSNTFNRPYKKSARIVGDVIGKYHPHGDSAVYDTIVRMVQSFSLRYPLVDGQGNFGSVDGDNPAAMRYTEIRMQKLTNELLNDLEKETVDFQPNYDESLSEPKVLPTRLPNLLMNGSSGIAVGMATNIAPHNLGELTAAITEMLNNPDVTDEELFALVPAPDFPTGGLISGSKGIRDAFFTGRGIVRMRAKTHIEDTATGGKAIIATELPYQVNKAKLQEKIAELVADKKLEGISDLRDESDRQGMRLVVVVKRNEVPEVVLNRLFKMTQFQSSFGVNNVALIHGQPRLLSTREMLTAFIDFRREVIVRRTRYDLRKAEERAHILEGLVKALDHLDEIIALIRAAKDPAVAKAGLIDKFSFSSAQAQAILDMRLQRLTGLERDKIVSEYNEILELIADLKDILARPERVRDITLEELTAATKSFDNPRRSQITADVENFDIEDLIADEPMVVTVSNNGYVKRTATHVYDAQRRGGKGKKGMQTRDEDFVAELFVATCHNYLLCFTDRGRVQWLKVHRIPEAGRGARGLPIVNLLDGLEDGEQVTAILPVKEFTDDQFIMMVTGRGTIKRTTLSAFSRPRANGIIAVDLDEGDALVRAILTDGESRILIVSSRGQAVMFEESDARAMGRTARGVRGISLGEDDVVISAFVAPENASVLTVSSKGYGKRTLVSEYRLTKRGSKGVRTMQTTDKTGPVASVRAVEDGDEVMLIANSGKLIRFKVVELRLLGRSTQGVRLFNLDKKESVSGLARIPADMVDEDDDETLLDEDGNVIEATDDAGGTSDDTAENAGDVQELDSQTDSADDEE